MAQPRTGPCSPWATLDDVCDVCASSGADGDLDDDLTERMLGVASDLLFLRTARRFSGVCTTTVRPCRRSYHGATEWGGWWWQSSWGWCGCDRRHPERGDCGCSSLSEITLGAEPIVDVLAVRIDGALLPETEYRVDDRRWLVRLDPEGEAWPSCQDLTAADTAPDTFSVQFTYGIDPPAAGVLAAATLACELALACAGSDSCRLPRRVQQITRDGVSMALLDPLTMFDEGRFGIPEVDMFIATYNPKKLQRRASVVSPHLRRPVRRVSDTGGS